MPDSTKGKLRFLFGFGLFFAALWLLWDTPAVYPLKIFVVLLHEVSHAIAVVISGGTVDRITLDPYQGGATYFSSGNALLALSAGYLGSLAWGGLMFSASRARWVRPDWVNGLIGVTVILLTVFVIRSAFGFVFGVVFGLTMIVASRKIGATMNRRLLLTLGLTSALYAILDIKSDVLDRPELHSDAYMLAEVTGIGTATVWGIVWISIALVFTGWLLHRAYRDA
ncbi:MAG: M50 family metallopeptidase [Gemmatimonadetes bacterium]|nr:M50 family metallopeptidase [Gemmatimonadota bacterium]MDA1103551.1 M50 family metallopeptidase [Gemmatimonadota bacterium]